MLNNAVAIYSPYIEPVTNSYESIATVTAAGGESTITFSSIPSTYKHVQIRVSIVSSTAGAVSYMTLNSATTNYSRHRLVGYGTGTDSFWSSNPASICIFGDYTGTAATPNAAAAIVDILDYQNTNKNKTMRIFSGVDRNGSGEIEFLSGLWMSTSAVNRLDFTIGGSVSTFAAGTQFALYGIKG